MIYSLVLSQDYRLLFHGHITYEKKNEHMLYSTKNVLYE